MKSVFSTIFIAIASATFALSSCKARERAGSEFAPHGREDLRGASPIRFQGTLWIGDSGIGGVLEPINGEGIKSVQIAYRIPQLGLSWHGERVEIITNTFEVECPSNRYRKVSETWLSADAAPLTRLAATDSSWISADHPMARWACGDVSVRPRGPHFSSALEFARLYDAEAERLGIRPRVTGPTVSARQPD